MLTSESLRQALPLTELLDARKMYLQPIPGTALAALVSSTRSGEKFNVPLDGGGWQPDLANIEFIANVQPTDGSVNLHDTAMDQATQIAIDAVRSHVAFAKNVVAPAVEELVQRVTDALNALSPSALLGMEVKVCGMPEVLANASLQQAVRRYADTAYDVPAMVVRMPEMDAAQIAELLSTAGSGMKAEIQAWLATKGDAFLSNLWSGVFQITPVAPGMTARSFKDWIECPVDGNDNALAIFLLAKRLMESTPDGVQMSARMLESALAEYRNQAAAKLCRTLDQEALYDRVGTLVRNQTERTVTVNAGVYRSWIEAGGSNEVLFGNALSRQPSYTKDDLTARSPELQTAWNKHAGSVAMLEATRKTVRTKELLASCFREQITQACEGDPSVQATKSIILRAFNEELELVREADLKDIYSCALRLVCRSRFVKTEAERILMGIELAKRENPSLDVREAAALSVIKYVAWWVSQQFKVVGL